MEEDGEDDEEDDVSWRLGAERAFLQRASAASLVAMSQYAHLLQQLPRVQFTPRRHES